MMAAGEGGYDSFVEPGDVVTLAGSKKPDIGQAGRRGCRRCRPIT